MTACHKQLIHLSAPVDAWWSAAPAAGPFLRSEALAVGAEHDEVLVERLLGGVAQYLEKVPAGGNCIKIGLTGKLIL